MTEREPSSYTSADLRDPNIDPATLTQLAQSRPDLWQGISSNLNCPVELANWIRLQIPNDPPLQQTQPPAPVTAEEWSARFQRATDREPTMSEYQSAVETGQILPERRPRDPSAEQMAAGAKQIAAGAKELFNNRVAPAAAGAARSVQGAMKERSAQQPSTTNWTTWAPFALPVTAFVTLVCLFLPAGTAFGMSINFFDEEAGGEGVFLLVLMLLVIATAVAAIITRKRWARNTAGIVGILVGLVGAIDGFGTMANISSIRGASVGAGAVLLAILSIVLLAAAVITLLPQTRPQSAQATQ
ncbi:MAG: hypothetical protein L0J68_06340 [Micrococcaceae bacterium]|uniref:variant leucine-rich repeat-containing protein n=1 Tax=Yaniella sp. TaxID=2773929 RepID=UPI002649E676|nr:hypothetical protein [Yaniella sp.]MDN5816472.1 hypothetical protein [Yaniella sp.]MDN6201748.1 hypothetical protein [Micrococcaceae bacterium]MDN6299891.1 hypothetical protein [Micrococcaceae bacterium]